jgi:hypothetical protein
MWKLDYDKVYSQVQVNTSLRRLEWTSNKLKDNIFEVIAIISKHRDLQMKGNPYLIKKSKREIRNQIWAWDFDYKGNPSRR